MEIDVKKIAADLGVILGIMLFMLNAIFYIVDIELFLNPTVSLYSLLFVIAFGCYSIINSRKKLGGYINWSDAFVSYMVCIAIGMAIAANRDKNIRAGLAFNPEIAKLMRQHNNANVLVLPGRFIDVQVALKCVDNFLSTNFESGRHKKRIDKLNKS